MGLGWILLGIAVALWVPGVFPAPAGPVLTPEQTFALGLSVALVLIGALEIFISNSGPFLYALYGEAGFQGMGAASCPIIVRCGSCGYVNMRGRRSCGRCRATL